ncbi:hypothetical protein J1614_005162 [Plenodomus biglobosus]|nr:hypothetical protein J1614_005162 [Plenodomus biglobosus]
MGGRLPDRPIELLYSASTPSIEQLHPSYWRSEKPDRRWRICRVLEDYLDNFSNWLPGAIFLSRPTLGLQWELQGGDCLVQVVYAFDKVRLDSHSTASTTTASMIESITT